MRTVMVKVARLAEALEKNRDAHEATFEKAWEGYRKRAIREFEARLDAAKAGEPFNIVIGLVPPENHMADYERALQMLDWHEDDEIELEEQEFRQFVEDDWGWKGRFVNTTAAYLAE